MHPVVTMCRVLGVSPGGYYARRKRPPSARARADAELSMQIAAIHRCSRATYGAPRIHAELREQGLRVGSKRVARLLRAAGLRGVSRATRSSPRCAIAPRGRRLIWWSATSPPRRPIACGSPISVRHDGQGG